MSRPEFKKLEQLIAAASLAYIIGHYLKMVDAIKGYFTYFGISIDLPIVIVIGFTLLLLISLRVVEFMWDFLPNSRHKIVTWTLCPSSRNLYIFPGFLNNNIFDLIFLNIEWRHLFKRTQCFASIELFDHTYILSKSNETLEWERENTAKPVRVNRFLPYKIKLLLIDPKNSYFQIIATGYRKQKFVPRKYGFETRLVENIYSKESSGSESSNKLDLLYSVEETKYLLINYEGGRQISVKRTNKKECDKYYWRKQLTNDYLP